ncbi:MAG TPA: PAS domain S-box protein [Gaiellaceae bacterium]|nr:PAS domain S-box protein [Gaiellaceae bacterium]
MAPDPPRDAAVTTETAALPEETAEELWEHAPAGYLSSLPGGEIVRVNATLLAWTGHRREDLVGRKRFHDLLPPGARIYYETHYAPLLQMQGSVREIAVELVRVDGTRLPVLLNSTLVRGDDGAPRAVRTTVFDATERRRYERELLRARADAEARARAVLALDHVQDGVLLVGREGRVEVLNPAVERILGVTAEEALGRPVTEAIPEWESLVAHVRVADPRRARAGFATVPLDQGGHEQWLALSGADSGDCVVYTIRDVTDEHRLEQLRSDLVAVVSHELRTPLTGVYGAAQTLLARHDSLGEESRRALLELVVEQTERLKGILDTMLLTGRLAAGQDSVAAEPFAAAEVVEALLAGISASDRGRVVVEAEPDVTVHGDLAAATQILQSLVDNALKYADGPVHLGVGAEGELVRFTVADAGQGVPPAERERIFDRFYRLDPDQRGGVGGPGLGLYIARELALRMGGAVGLLPGGRGATFFLDLPRARTS